MAGWHELQIIPTTDEHGPIELYYQSLDAQDQIIVVLRDGRIGTLDEDGEITFGNLHTILMNILRKANRYEKGGTTE